MTRRVKAALSAVFSVTVATISGATESPHSPAQRALDKR